MPLLVVLACACFVASLSVRVVDPVIPEIARELTVAPATVAMLASAFAVPYALSQPLLGPLGDTIGKALIIKVCLAVLAAALIASALAPNIEMLFAARIVAGAAGGGLIPVALAVVGDRFAIEERQVALSRVLGAMLTAVLVGAIGSGMIADLFGWRVVLVIAAALTAAALWIALVNLKPRADRARQKFSLERILTGYRTVFQNPRAKICFSAVFIEGVIVFGFLPYIAILLEQRGAGGIREAGFVLAGMGAGGVLYTVAVPVLLRRLGGMFNLMRVGGALVALGFAGVAAGGPWLLEAMAFVLVGFGFYAIHNSLQTQATELAPENRGSAVSLHAFFFFLGHAAGPPVYALAFATAGAFATLAAVVVVTPLLAMLLARLLEPRPVTG
ncbi:MAG: MFS transporter [Hyphomicrobiaceae bacterium]|nr:MFS transporter [Hyphomicrobiaceae bacterium]